MEGTPPNWLTNDSEALTATPEFPLNFNITTGDILFYCYKYTLIGVLTLVCIFGNLLVILSSRHVKLRSPCLDFIIGLALSDLLTGLLYPVYTVSHIELHEIRNSLGMLEIQIFNLLKNNM